MNGHWLARPMLRERATFARVALAAVMINLFGLASSLFSMTVYDRVVPHAAFASLVALTIGLGVVVLFDFVLRVLRGWFVDQAGAGIDRAVAEEAFARLVAMRLSERRGSTGATAGILRELETLRDFFASATLTALVDLPFMALTLVVVAMIGGWIVMVPVVVIPLVIVSALAARPMIERGSRDALAQGLSKQTILVETIGAIETVKANGAGPMLARRWLHATDQQAVTAMRQRLISNLAVTVSVSANSVVYAGVIVAGVFMVADRALTTGGLIACSMLAGRAIAPLGQIATLLARLASTRAAYRQIDTMMRQPVEGPAANAIAPATIRGDIEFRGVDFTYPGAAGRTLDRLDLSIRPGEHVAIVGRVGSGKSTLARLALGLHEPQAGMVLLDGIDVRQFDPVALRAAMGVALQEAALFSGTVRENIVLDRAHVDEDEMRRAAGVSGAHGFLQSMTNGYDLRLADRGEGLSGGQRQAVGLARALAGRPPLLILDEPTSAMDGQSEAALLERLRAEIEGRTFLCITHRPALLALARRVVVIERGRVVEDGPRDAILAKLNRPRAA